MRNDALAMVCCGVFFCFGVLAGQQYQIDLTEEQHRRNYSTSRRWERLAPRYDITMSLTDIILPAVPAREYQQGYLTHVPIYY